MNSSRMSLITCVGLGTVLDLGADNANTRDDYPDYSEAVGLAVLEKRSDRGIVICGSGVGASVAANKLPGIRACLVMTLIQLIRAWNNDDIERTRAGRASNRNGDGARVSPRVHCRRVFR